jgi:hypothetical protein
VQPIPDHYNISEIGAGFPTSFGYDVEKSVRTRDFLRRFPNLRQPGDEMKIEKLSPADQQRVLRFVKQLAQIFRRIKRDAEKGQDEKNQDEPAKEKPDGKQ